MILAALILLVLVIIYATPDQKRWCSLPPRWVKWPRNRRRLFFIWLGKHDVRYFGYTEWYYDGPIPAFGFWWFHVALDYL